MKRKLLSAAALCGLALCLTPKAFADTVGGTLGVTATVTKSCSFSNSPSISIGDYSPSSGNNESATVDVSCSGIADGSTLDFTADNGANYDFGSEGAGSARNMYSSNASYYLPYTLSLTSGGSDLSNSATVAVTITGGTGNATLYANVATGDVSAPAATDYSDTVNLTLTY